MTNKYHARKVEIDGIIFDSVAESVRFRELRILQEAGEISSLVVHPRFVLYPTARIAGEKLSAISYTPDFQYTEAGAVIIEDVKGVETEAFRLRLNLFRRCYPGVVVRIVKNGRVQR